MDRAIALDHPDDPVRADERLRQIPLLVLDDGELPRSIDEQCLRGETIAHPLPDPVAGHPPPFVEDAIDQLLATDRADRRQQPAREAVVIGGEEVLGGVGDVVHVARPPDTVANGLPADEAGGLERVELLQYPGPAHAERRGKILGGARPIVSQAEQ